MESRGHLGEHGEWLDHFGQLGTSIGHPPSFNVPKLDVITEEAEEGLDLERALKDGVLEVRPGE